MFYAATLLSFLISSVSFSFFFFLVESLDFLFKIISSANKVSFTSFSNLNAFYLFFLPHYSDFQYYAE